MMTQFDPVLYSKEENEFLLTTIGQPPVVAMRTVAPGVNPKAVKPVLDRVYELEQLKAHEGAEWAGVDAVKEAIRIFLKVDEKWASDAQRSRRAPRHPSMYSFDTRGRAFLYGPGSDSGRPRTYFDAEGKRKPFAVELVPENVMDWVAPTLVGEIANTHLLITDAEKNRIECGICGHTESFKPNSRSSEVAARARMSKHLRTAKDQTDAHRELHTAEFGTNVER